MAVGLLGLAGFAVYSNSFGAPFVFDGLHYLERLRVFDHWWPEWDILLASNRPVGLYSFALNYALGGEQLWSYLLVNIVVHIAAAAVLFAVVRRTLEMGRYCELLRGWAFALALTVALIWLVHPLQTASVTYLYQRYESLMGLFYLLTLYAFVRAQRSSRPLLWHTASIAFWLLALGTKEAAATAPLVVLWYDRVFVARSWNELARKRGPYYAVMALIFAAGAAYVITHHSTYAAGGVLGDDVTPLEYARTQPGVILHYLRLVFWPAGQCLDYGWPVATSFAEIVPPLLALLALLALTSWAAVHRPALGFLGGVFFILLAPSSSFAPLRDLAFEHRMYLPLAAVVTFIAAEVASLARSHRGEGASRNDHRRSLILTGIAAGVCVILGTGSHARNRVYANSFSAWEDVVEKAPANWRGHYNLGTEYMKAGDFARAEPLLRETIALRPTSYDAHFNLAIVLRGLGRFDESLASFTAAEEIRSDDPQLFANRGALLWDLGRSNDALRDYERALQLDAGNVLALTNYAQTLMEQDRPAEAVMLLRRAILSEPRRADVYVRLGLALAALGETCEAQVALEKAVEMNPRSPQAHYNLGRLLISSRPDLAARHFEATVRLDPGISDAHNNLGVLFESGDPRRAIRHYQDAVRADPSNLKARSNLQSLLRSSP